LSCKIYSFIDADPAAAFRGRPRSTASTSSSEISVADDNTSLDLLHDILQNRDIVRTKVSWYLQWLCALSEIVGCWFMIILCWCKLCAVKSY